jgi:hypothetical protein
MTTKQHYIPAFHLGLFSNEITSPLRKSRISVIRPGKSNISDVQAETQAHKTNLYEPSSLEYNELENRFSVFEGEASILFRKLIDDKWFSGKGEVLRLSASEYELLIAYHLHLLARHPKIMGSKKDQIDVINQFSPIPVDEAVHDVDALYGIFLRVLLSQEIRSKINHTIKLTLLSVEESIPFDLDNPLLRSEKPKEDGWDYIMPLSNKKMLIFTYLHETNRKKDKKNRIPKLAKSLPGDVPIGVWTMVKSILANTGSTHAWVCGVEDEIFFQEYLDKPVDELATYAAGGQLIIR